jgi:putative ABC transport system permease protein
MAYIQDRDLGFDKEHVVVLPIDQTQRDRVGTIKQAKASPSSVERVAATSHLPINGVAANTYRISGTEDRHLLNTLRVDADFISLMDIDLVAGEPFSGADVRTQEETAERCALVLNEAAARHFGWKPDEVPGKELRSAAIGGASCAIKGVVADFHFASLHEEVEPLILLAQSSFYHLLVRTSPGDIRATLDDLEEAWTSAVPGQPFTYEFLDQEYDAVYRSEQRTGQLFTAFSLLAVFVSCLGLFGLAAFAVVQRTREIGVRKVLGARSGQIVALLTREFAGLIAVAFVVGVPLAYFGATRWLDGFAYRAALSPWLFVAAGALVLTIALLTVSVHAARAATSDPVKALRYE